MRLRQGEDGGAVGHVTDQGSAGRRLLARAPEDLGLLAREREIRLVRAGKMARDSAQAQAGPGGAASQEILHLVGTHPDPPHAGVDHDVHGDAAPGPGRRPVERLEHLRRAHDRLEAVGGDALRMLGKRRREQHEGRPHAGLRELHGLRRMGHAQRVAALLNEVTRHELRPVPVGVGLDGGPQRPTAGERAQQPEVVAEAVPVDDGPGQVGCTERGGHASSARR
jgi:hypothetical protein